MISSLSIQNVTGVIKWCALRCQARHRRFDLPANTGRWSSCKANFALPDFDRGFALSLSPSSPVKAT